MHMRPKSPFYKTLEYMFPRFKKICIVTRTFPPYPKSATSIAVGGIDRKYERIVDELRYYKNKICIISLYFENISKDQDDRDVNRIGVYRPYTIYNLKYLYPLLEFFNPLIFIRCLKVLMRQRPDLVIIGGVFQMSLAPIFAAKVLGIDVVIQHDRLCPLFPRGACDFIRRVKKCGECLEKSMMSNQNKLIKVFFGIFSAFMFIIKRNIWNTCTVFAESHYFKNFYLRSGIRPKEIYMAPPSPTIDDFTEHDQKFMSELEGLLGNTKVIAYIGRLSQEKGIELLLESYKILKGKTKHKTRLVIAGDGPLRNLVINEAKNDPSILYLDWLSKDKLKCVYLLTDMILIPSPVRESCPHVALEAIHFERPIIGFGLGALKEILSSYPKGITVDKVSSKKLAEAIQQKIVG